MTRYTVFGITILIGFVFAVYYGWAARPVGLADASPAMLRADFRADYALMVAEAYQADQDAERAIAELSFLGSEGQAYNPYALISDALAFGSENGFSVSDLALLQNLQAALLEFDPGFASTPAP